MWIAKNKVSNFSSNLLYRLTKILIILPLDEKFGVFLDWIFLSYLYLLLEELRLLNIKLLFLFYVFLLFWPEKGFLGRGYILFYDFIIIIDS